METSLNKILSWKCIQKKNIFLKQYFVITPVLIIQTKLKVTDLFFQFVFFFLAYFAGYVRNKKKKKKKVGKLQKYKSECKKKNIAKGVIRIVQMCLPGNATTAP